jgi:hypothetical protein
MDSSKCAKLSRACVCITPAPAPLPRPARARKIKHSAVKPLNNGAPKDTREVRLLSHLHRITALRWMHVGAAHVAIRQLVVPVPAE